MGDQKRVVLDCRQVPDSDCSVTISGTEDEVLALAEFHATTRHGAKPVPGLRDQLRSFLREEALAG